MRKFIVLAALLSMLFGQVILGWAFELEVPKGVANDITDTIYLKQLEQHSVQIFSFMPGLGICTGTLIAEDTFFDLSYILACKHCVSISEECFVENIQVETITLSVDDDLMLLTIPGRIKNKTPISHISCSELEDKVYFVGHPYMINSKVYSKSGTVIKKTKDWHWAEMEAIPGCSGSGIFNSSFGLTGVLWGAVIGEGITLFEPAEDIIKFLDSLNINYNVL